MIGYAICGSFCTHSDSLAVLAGLCGRYDVLPILSEKSASLDTRFGRAAELAARTEELCGRKNILTIQDSEPLGPKNPLDALVICPCTGNTLAKLAAGITDGTVTMAAKAHMRLSRPLVIALATNDAMAANLKNIAAMCEKKNVFFVPLRQDDPEKKPFSLVADFSLVEDSLEAALNGKQLRPLFI